MPHEGLAEGRLQALQAGAPGGDAAQARGEAVLRRGRAERANVNVCVLRKCL